MDQITTQSLSSSQEIVHTRRLSQKYNISVNNSVISNGKAEQSKQQQQQTIYFRVHKNFTRLCPDHRRQQEKEAKKCPLCQVSLKKLFSSKVICEFCGIYVCEECSKHKRKNPENPKNFVKICDGCHEDFIYLKQQEKFQIKNQKRIDEKKKRDENINKEHLYVLQNQQKKNTLDIQNDKNYREMKEQIFIQNKYKKQVENDIFQLEKDNKLLTQEQQGINGEIDKIQKATDQYKKLINHHEKENLALQEELHEFEEYNLELNQQHLKMLQKQQDIGVYQQSMYYNYMESTTETDIIKPRDKNFEHSVITQSETQTEIDNNDIPNLSSPRSKKKKPIQSYYNQNRENTVMYSEIKKHKISNRKQKPEGGKSCGLFSACTL